MGSDERARKLKLQSRMALVVLVLGFILMVRQMVYDDEPGAIPLLLILSSLVWFFTTRSRIRRLG